MSSRRIILNTGVTYARTVLAFALALFSSRWVLAGLGQIDFGLFAVVGSLIACVVFLNGILAGSASRHFAYAIGKGNSDDVNRWFNTALFIHLLMPTVLILVGYPIGEYFIKHVLSIPPERVYACLWVFRLSLCSTFISMSGAPFLAMFIAKQRIFETAIWGIIQTVITFCFAYYLMRAHGDRLIIYSMGMVLIASVMILIQIGRAAVIFKECKITRCYWFDRTRAKELFSFASWSMIGSLGTMLRGQGSSIILNMFYGPRLNAAFGIANQVSGQAYTFTGAMTQAMGPELMTAAGHGDSQRVHDLSLQTCKFGVLLFLLFSIPIWIEMRNVLQLWLGSPPEYAIIFTRIMIVVLLVDTLTVGNMIAVSAYGKIRAYQATVGAMMFLTLPLSYCMLKWFHVPQAAVYAILITSVGCTIGRVLWGRILLNHSLGGWITSVLWRCLLVGVPSVGLALLPQLFMQANLWRLIVVSSVSISSVSLFSWFFGLTRRERTYFIRAIESGMDKSLSLLPDRLRPIFTRSAGIIVRLLNVGEIASE
jgi:O-antigen/teichoic acid export membrane protein